MPSEVILMLVLTSRLHEKIMMPENRTTIEVVAIQPGAVRLGIDAPPDVRILREAIPDRVAEWGPEDAPASSPSMQQVNQLIQKRLEIARHAVSEIRTHLRGDDHEDVQVLLERLDEDLRLLRRRVRREVEKNGPAREAALCM
jgi:carbon storage regulator CsrA